MTPREKDVPQRILCIRMSGLGDVVHALNALSLLHRERPGAEIHWMVEDRFAGLLQGHPYLEDLITVPRKRWGDMMKRPGRWPRLGREMKSLSGRLRALDFDVSVDVQSSLKSAWLVMAARAPVRIGFGGPVSREFNHLVQNRTVHVPADGIHRIERDLALLKPLGIEPDYAPPVLPSSEPDRRAIDRALQGTLGGGPLVIIHPGTSEFAAFKRWLPERYSRVADELVRRRGADVLVTWGPADRELAGEVVDGMEEDGILAPRTEGLGRYAELLRRADLFIGSDTGPMHLASALGVPVVALFGPKDPIQTGPYCSRSIVVTGRADCRPCDRRKCPHVRCMTSITPDQVLDAALHALDGEGECRGRLASAGRAVADA